MALWSGRTGDTPLSAEAKRFLKAEDAELLPYDCEGTRIHAERLRGAGIITDAEFDEVDAALERIAKQGAAAISDEDEDVHSSIERLLGEVGRKIHAGRSRNDQVATAFRLYVAAACREGLAAIDALAATVLDRAEREAETAMPGFTHLQRAQPVTLGHHLLAWVEMLERDRNRFLLAERHAAPVPLGAGALAGSTLELPAPDNQVANSLDAVADRDFALDYLYGTAGLFVHLSRIAEELVLWVTAEFGFARLPETAATGSSMMPQKLNPDVAELVRGKAGSAIGRLAGLLSTIKGLPLAYNLDLQEDKEPVFAARRDVSRALAALEVLIGDLEFNHERLAEAASDPVLLATDEAELLVAQGQPFRDAHEQIAGRVRGGTLAPSAGTAESIASRQAPGPGSTAAAVASARERLQRRRATTSGTTR